MQNILNIFILKTVLNNKNLNEFTKYTMINIKKISIKMLPQKFVKIFIITYM